MAPGAVLLEPEEGQPNLPPRPPHPGLLSPPGLHSAADLEQEPKRHSRLGIASFTIILSVDVLYLALQIMAEALMAEYLRTDNFSETGMTALGLGLMLLIAAAITALALGIAGLAQSRRKKVFAVLGTVFSVLFLVFVAITMAMA